MLKLVVFALLVQSSFCEWYSSIGHMEDLVYEEMGLLTTLDGYIEAEEKKLDKIKNFASTMKNNAEEMKNNLEKYLGEFILYLSGLVVPNVCGTGLLWAL